jgi:hypothetical protein
MKRSRSDSAREGSCCDSAIKALIPRPVLVRVYSSGFPRVLNAILVAKRVFEERDIDPLTARGA